MLTDNFLNDVCFKLSQTTLFYQIRLYVVCKLFSHVITPSIPLVVTDVKLDLSFMVYTTKI